ncbi:MAG: hypothetical protein KatS3mg008_0689 [Acidimicrobiales bacterium]|nr:MAG: hypothetical protein KatS3mg008_0689 [Acidimicrobiales bacterium]
MRVFSRIRTLFDVRPCAGPGPAHGSAARHTSPLIGEPQDVLRPVAQRPNVQRIDCSLAARRPEPTYEDCDPPTALSRRSHRRRRAPTSLVGPTGEGLAQGEPHGDLRTQRHHRPIKIQQIPDPLDPTESNQKGTRHPGRPRRPLEHLRQDQTGESGALLPPGTKRGGPHLPVRNEPHRRWALAEQPPRIDVFSVTPHREVERTRNPPEWPARRYEVPDPNRRPVEKRVAGLDPVPVQKRDVEGPAHRTGEHHHAGSCGQHLLRTRHVIFPATISRTPR